jgi:hypothetical protein
VYLEYMYGDEGRCVHRQGVQQMVRSCRTEQSNSETESGRKKDSLYKKEAGPSDLPSGKGTMSLRSLSPRIWGSRADGPER